MTRMSTLLAALLLAFTSAAFAADDTAGSTKPSKPVTGQGAATTVATNPAATESGGKADKGLATAEKNISKPKKHVGKHEGREEKAERAEKGEKVERPEKPERPSR